MPHQNTLYTGDNLHVMRCLESESVDLIYLDPPFNTMKMRKWKDDKGKEQSYIDLWHWKELEDDHGYHALKKNGSLLDYLPIIKIMHDEAMMVYITFMASRLIEMHRLLKNTGSIYLHCDWRACHYLRSVLDIIFGKDNFCNEIIWRRGRNIKGSTYQYHRNHETIFWYCKSREVLSPLPQVDYKPYAENTLKMYRYDDDNGKGKYRLQELRSYGQDTIKKMDQEGKIVTKDKGKQYFKQYFQDKPGVRIDAMWDDIPSLEGGNRGERTGYDSQKPLKLLSRIIKASSNEGDVVLDPFCGCATACVAAHNLHRQWIGIDSNRKAQEHLIDRLKNKATGSLFKDFIHLEGKSIQNLRDDFPSARPQDEKVRLHFYGQQGETAKCKGCQESCAKKFLEVDHIIPKSKGGIDAIENYQLLCTNCNKIKGNRTQKYLENRLKEMEKARHDTTY